jgi:hypothetical protein
MKRPTNIKDSIMMPPPKARPKSRSDTSEELRKNLMETISNTTENSAIQEEFNRYFKEMEGELELKKYDDELSMSKSTSSINFDKYHSMSPNCSNVLCMCSNNNMLSTSNLSNLNNNPQSLTNGTNKSFENHPPQESGAFNFNLVHYTYTSMSDDEENTESQMSMEKLRKNLTQGYTLKTNVRLIICIKFSTKIIQNFLYQKIKKKLKYLLIIYQHI